MKKGIKIQHDQFFKVSMGKPHIAKAFLQNNLPDRLKGKIKWETLKLFESSTVDAGLKARLGDITYEAEMTNGHGYFIVAFEHKSYPDKWASYQLFRSMIRVLDIHLEQQEKPQVLPLVFGMLVYNVKSLTATQQIFMICLERIKR